MKSYASIFRPGSGWAAFFTSILVWGIGIGCFQAAFNNFLVDMYDIDGVDRGVLEFLRETPGVLLIAILALLHKCSDWKVLRIGTFISLAAAGLLMVPVPWMGAVVFITIWALGEHLVMPVRQAHPYALQEIRSAQEAASHSTRRYCTGYAVHSRRGSAYLQRK